MFGDYMKKIGFLTIAVIGNALGTALMAETELGMTAWGSGALNLSNFFDISLGLGFVCLSILFYIIAITIRKEFIFNEFLMSFAFLFAFGVFTDIFILLLPELIQLSFVVRIMLNLFGLLILLFAIALHLRVNLAVHPMDVFLSVMHKQFKNVAIGTYFVYFIGFAVAIIFGLLHGVIEGVGIGTVNTLLLSGIIMKYYDNKLRLFI